MVVPNHHLIQAHPLMLQYLMWFEVALKLGCGLILGLFPVSSPRLFGLPSPSGPFWPRLLAAVLIGIGLAVVLQTSLTPGRGLGLAGLMAINLVAAAVATGQLVMGSITTRRGTATLWALAITLTGLSLVELAYV
jgi:hypothetical protein